MTTPDEEAERLRSVALKNAESILIARGRAEEALRKQSEWLRITLAGIGDAVMSTDADGRITFMNAVAEKLTLWPAAEAMGRFLPDVFHIVNERTRKLVENPALRCLNEGVIVGLANHTLLIARDGTERPIDDSAAPIWDDSGAAIGAVLVFRDVTERKRAEVLQSRLAAIVETSEDVIISKNLEGIIQTWNAAAERLFGFTAHEAIGQSIYLIIPPERRDEEHEIIARIVNGERVEHFETVRMSKDGRRIDISLTISPIRDGAGRIVGASKIARDIADRRRVEHALREENRRKNEFLALLAHELRNPLAPLRNGLHVMRLAESDAKAVARARGMMERQLGHIVRLVDDLLDISRINQNKIELRRSRVLMADVISSAVETARPLIDAAGHELTVLLSPEPIHIDADLTRLAQVFSNLLTNSAKYTERCGRIWLTVERRRGEVAVSVRDNGIGIPHDDLSRIFDMFSQVDRSVERTTGGLGIGLALVKALVELHDGTVTVVSAGQGKGSTFTVILPALESQTDLLATAATDSVQHDDRPSRRVLVADDNRDSANSMAMLLKLMGNDVRTAHDGIEAVETAAAFGPEVILMDVGMPKLNGLDATRRIRQQPWGQSIIIVALTGWGQEDDMTRSQEAGCDGHLVKPVEIADLEQVLADFSKRELR